MFSAILAKHGRRIPLPDFGAESVAFYRDVFAQADSPGRFVQADMCQVLPFPGGEFDCTRSSGLPEHFTDGQPGRILKVPTRVTRKCVVSLMPNVWSLF